MFKKKQERSVDRTVRSGVRFSAEAIISIAIFVAILVSGQAIASFMDPFPDPYNILLFADGETLFDSSTDAYSFSGSIYAVQFPGQEVSTDDPLVLANSVLSIEGYFSGEALDPFSDLDIGGVFSTMTTRITVDGNLAYSDVVPELSFLGIFDTPNGHFADWLGGSIESQFFDSTVINSPFLSLWSDTRMMTTAAGTVYEIYDLGSGELLNSGVDAPEPATLLMLGLGGLALRRKRRAC